MKTTLVTLLILATLPVLGQEVPPPEVHFVSPPGGPTAGGTIVNIHGRGFDAKIDCFAPCPTRVWFGDAEAELLVELDDLVGVLSPPHPEGTVPVTIRRSDGVEVETEFTYANSENPWEPILLPILIDRTEGAHGSLWQSTFWLHNGSNEVVSLAHLECENACPEIFPLTLNVDPGTTVENPRLGFNPPGQTPGTLIYGLREEIDGVSFSLRIDDLSRESLTRGTEIPVIRREELLSGKTELIDVPLDELFRSALRIYDLDARKRLDFWVRFFPVEGGPVLGPPLIEVRLSTTADHPFFLTGKPGYLQILDLRAAYPQIAHLRRARIEIEPVTPGVRYWAFVSVANVTTQQVSTITPQ